VLADQETDHVAWTAIVRSIQVLVFLRHLMVARQEVVKTFRVDCADRLRQVAVRARVSKIKHIGGEVSDYPREDWVLRQVKRAALSVSVQDLKVLEVGDLSLHPLIRVYLNVGLFCLTFAWQVVEDALVDLVTLLLVIEAEK